MSRFVPGPRAISDVGPPRESDEAEKNSTTAPEAEKDVAAGSSESPCEHTAGEESVMPVEAETKAADTKVIDEKRGADPDAVGDLFNNDSTLMEDNPLFRPIGKDTPKIEHWEDILRLASRRPIAEIVEMYHAKTGETITNKHISTRLDNAKKQIAKVRGYRRKDIVAAFEKTKFIFNVEKKKNMAASKKRIAKKEAAGLIGKNKRHRQRRGAKMDQSAEEADESDDMKKLEKSLEEDEVGQSPRSTEQRTKTTESTNMTSPSPSSSPSPTQSATGASENGDIKKGDNKKGEAADALVMLSRSKATHEMQIDN